MTNGMEAAFTSHSDIALDQVKKEITWRLKVKWDPNDGSRSYMAAQYYRLVIWSDAAETGVSYLREQWVWKGAPD